MRKIFGNIFASFIEKPHAQRYMIFTYPSLSTRSMEGAVDLKEKPENFNLSEADLLERFGIQRVCVYSYIVGPYKYSKIEDAIAQVKRERSSC